MNMRKPTIGDVDAAWRSWVAVDIAYPAHDMALQSEGFSPITAVRMIAHARFSCMFCDYIKQSEPERFIKITKLDVMRAIAGHQREMQEWLEDWEILPDSLAKDHYRRHLAESQRSRMELICLRHLWLASQARRPFSVR